MTPSQYIKAQGLPSLVYVAGKVNKDPRTINKWYDDNFALFEVVVAGCKYKVLQDVKLREAMGEEMWAKIKGKDYG